MAVLLLPVDRGLLAIRRGIEPCRGELALPGGYVDFDETWQAAAASELREEAGVVIDPAEIQVFDVASARDGSLLVFGLGRRRTKRALPPFHPTAETTERVVLTAPTKLAFALHTAEMAAYFDEHRGG